MKITPDQLEALGDLQHVQVAEILGVNESTVRRWRKALRAQVEMATPEGFSFERATIQVDRDGNVERMWAKGKAQAERFLEALEAFYDSRPDAAAEPSPAPERCSSDLLTAYPVPDVHFGMYAWKEETGNNYDIEIAQSRLLAGMESIIEKTPASETAIVSFLGDSLHANDDTGQTKHNKNILDTDGRYEKVTAKAIETFTSVIDRLALKHVKVKADVRKGNHDEDAAVWLGHVLRAHYRHCPRIEIVENPAPMTMMQWGVWGIGFIHGHTATPKQIAERVPQVNRKLWGQVERFHIFLGHRHALGLEEKPGIAVETLPPICPNDAWSAGKLFGSMPALHAITFDRNKLEIERAIVGLTGA